MNWILGISVLIIILYLVNHQLKINKLRALKKHFENNWGKPKEEQYYNFEIIDQYFRNSTHRSTAYHVLSDQTNEDLDLHDLFKYLDRTTSKVGQQYLYYKLRCVGSKDALLKFDRLTKTMESDSNLRLECQLEFAKISNEYAYDFEKLIHDEIKKPSYQKFLMPLSIGYVAAFCLAFFHPIFFLFIFPILMVNLVLHYKTKSYLSYYLSSVSQLNQTFIAAERIASNPEIQNQFPDREFLKTVRKVRSKTKYIGFEKKIAADWAAPFWLLCELLKIQINYEAILFFKFIDDIKEKRKSLDELYQFIGEIDSAISTASVKHTNKLVCTPVFTEKKELRITEMIHPLIQDCIPNDLNLYDKSILLTGSNMSGKTTFIRAVALSSITAQTVNIAFAKEFHIPFFKVYSSIRITDDLSDGTSYYLKEVLTIKELIEVAKDPNPCLFVLDEIFKGTNTIERISGGKAILSYLNKEKDFVFVSTHDIELADLLKTNDFDLHHFSEKIKNNELFFDYKLKQGKLKTRNAIKILELYDYPQQIITDAKETEKNNFS